MRCVKATSLMVLGGCFLLLANGCGDGDSPTGGTTTTAPASTVISQGSFQIGTVQTAVQTGDACDFLEFIAFQTTATGTIEAVVDWTFPSSDLDVALISGACNCNLVIANACETQTIAESTSATAKPERISAQNRAAGSYTLVVANFSAQPESGSYQVTLTR